MVLPNAARAERLADGIDAKYQESRLIPVAAIGFGFEEIRVDEQVLFIVGGEGAFGRRLIGHRRVERIASPGMLLNKSPPVVGVATPNRIDVADGGKNQHASAARGGVGCDQALPIVGSIGQGAHPRRALRDDGLAS
jgi:hypothetical protein